MTTLIADPPVAEIPLQDCGEPLVDYDGCLVRAGLAARLQLAQTSLPAGTRLHLAEGFRTAADQQAIERTYADTLRAAHPGITEQDLRNLTSRYVAPLDVAPHVAGAAVDLTLVDVRGHHLWMGTPIDATPEESNGACFFDAHGIDQEARRNRGLLADALGCAGLVNYPTEWWHWSFGDRYWAFVAGADEAIYGPVAA